MTQVGMMIFQDGWEKGREEMVLNMFREGLSFEQISRAVQGTMPDARLKELQNMAQEDACAAV